ncbi:PEP-CTERM sorting domain-containing protein [Sulfuriroseicoccus oceanibius]|uniref:PEP-CTERM sorting domain-containing protein n=1 Tax=Sulfuriroseicoccus oceanibius TaxID=2707525 RepID=A0A6B3L5E1_9BACT|nr:PEP-CTERM sorting domain-containing protein [Sulfuriroseicoccus oceanibius]QQL44944.1 PEP-CTERM sorting domain-containing protein [Sulfuriroseicoccus oceanibius]
MKTLLTTMSALALGALTANAVTLASYDSGVAAQAGAAGAADPTSQGWSAVIGTNTYLVGQDTGNGGWNLSDGTNSGVVYYEHSLDAAATTEMANGWTLDFTVASDNDLFDTGGGSLDNWVTSSRQQANVWIENSTAGYFYLLTITHDPADGSVSIGDGTNTFLVGTDLVSQQVGDGAPAMNFIDFTLTYDAGTGTATLTDSEGGNNAIASAGTGSSDRLIFGTTSSGSLGSTTWNSVTLDSVPEPSSALLTGLGGLALILRRRK